MPFAHELVQQVGERRRRLRERVSLHQQQRDRRDDDVDAGREKRAEHRRARNGALGIAHASCGNRGRLDAEHCEQGERRGGQQRLERDRRGRHVARVGGRLAEEHPRAQSDDRHHRQQLERRRDDLHAAAHAHAEQVHADEQPYQRGSLHRGRDPRHGRKHVAYVARQTDRNRRIGDPARHPVAPDCQERRQGPGRALDVGIGAVGRGELTRELREHLRNHAHADDDHGPAEQRVEAVWRERGRQHEYADADGVADHQRRAHPEPEFLGLLHAGQPPLPCSASSSAARSSTIASSTSATVVDSGGMKRNVLTPHESSNRPL